MPVLHACDANNELHHNVPTPTQDLQGWSQPCTQRNISQPLPLSSPFTQAYSTCCLHPLPILPHHLALQMLLEAAQHCPLHLPALMLVVFPCCSITVCSVCRPGKTGVKLKFSTSSMIGCWCCFKRGSCLRKVPKWTLHIWPGSSCYGLQP